MERQRKRLKQQAAKLSFDLEEEAEDAVGNAKPIRIGPDPSALVQGQLEAKNFAEIQRLREEEELAKIRAEDEFISSTTHFPH